MRLHLPQLADDVLACTTRPRRAQECTEEYYFLTGWLELVRMRGVPEKITRRVGELVLHRDQVVAASVIQWLGTNGGAGFLFEVKRATPRDGNPEAFMRRLWGKTVEGHAAVNYGYGTLELILNTKPECEFDHLRPGEAGLIDPVSERDERVAAVVMAWVATEDGQAFVRLIESRIELEKQRTRLIHHHQNNLGLLARNASVTPVL